MLKQIILTIIFLFNVSVCSAEINVHYSKTIDETHKGYVEKSINVSRNYFVNNVAIDIYSADIYVVSTKDELGSLPLNRGYYYLLQKDKSLAGICHEDKIIVIIPNTKSYKDVLFLISHELTHVVQSELGTPYQVYDKWMIEGTAQYVGYKLAEFQPTINDEILKISSDELNNKNWCVSGWKYGYFNVYNRSWLEVVKLANTKTDRQIFDTFVLIKLPGGGVH